MTSYPGAVWSPTTVTDGVDYPQATHINSLQNEIVQLESALGINPTTIDQTVSPSASPASVAAYLDMVAYLLKAIRGNTNWYSTTGISSQFMLSGWAPTTTSGFTRGTLIETSTNKVNIVNNSFPNGSQTYGFLNFPMPSDYDGGTVTATFYWTANSTSTNSVIWGLAGVAFADNDALDTAYGTAQEVTDANGSSAYTERTSAASSAITIAGTPTAGKMVSWRVYRKGSGSDNLAVAASLIAVLVTYTRA